MDSMNKLQKVFTVYLVLLLIYWVILHISGQTESTYNFLYSFLFSLVPLIGGLIGMFQSKVWGGIKSHVGKAVFFISLGLFLWGAGSMGWSYYNLIAHVAAPYPSLADLGFAPSIFFYGLGAVYLSKATGAKYGYRSSGMSKVFAYLAPLIILAASYYLLIVVARGGVLIPEGETPLKTILDIAYPLGDFVSLAIAVVVSGLSFKYLGGQFIHSIVAVWIGLAVMFVADTVFSYTTTVGTFYNGNWGDLLLTIGLFALTFGALGFYKRREKIA
jgi:hypothetical protein